MPVAKIHFVSWKWKQAGHRELYTADHVNVLQDMLVRNCTIPFRHICVTDDPSRINPRIDFQPLWPDLNDRPNICGQHLPSCYRRLRLFDPLVQREMGIGKGERIVSIDLDVVIVANTDHHWRRDERFVGWARRGTYHPTVFNGSLWMFSAGDLEYMWTEFDPNTSPREANKAGYMGSDQSWLSYKLIREPWVGGFSAPQVVSYANDVRNKRVPNGVDIVFFHGKRKPWHPQTQAEAPWIRDHWRMSTLSGHRIPDRGAEILA